jgi:hypothetical protein
MIVSEAKVKTALLNYQVSGGQDVNAGWNVMRYAKAGYLKIISDDLPQEFIQWYPLEMSYLILRLAKNGKLVYQPAE